MEYVSAPKSSRPKVFWKKYFEKFLKFPLAILLKKTAAQMFPLEFRETSKNTYLLEIWEQLLLSCYFSNLKIFSFHALELYQ